MKRIAVLSIAAAIGSLAGTAHAVVLNTRGLGQALIFPYYTVNHQQTLLSVVNTTAHGKALKVRFREGYDGRDVAAFNVYLGPYDSWVGSVFDTSSDGTGAAAIATNDNSCTVPAFSAMPIPGGPKALIFSNQNYSQGPYGAPTGLDSGPIGLNRTREGFFEIIEMGEVVDQASETRMTLEAVTPVNGKPPGCAQVQSAWASGGYWITSANIDLLPPGGGVYGAAGIIDVVQGTLYAYDATSIDGFSDVIQHTAPGATNPNLSTAITDSSHQIASAYVPYGNALLKADYPTPSRGIDAVSAVLMASTLYNEFNSNPVLGAQTDFLVTFPTKQYYVDPGIVGTTGTSAAQPFGEVFGGGLSGSAPYDPGNACVETNAAFFDRESTMPPVTGQVCGGGVPLTASQYLCYQTEAIPLGAHARSPGSLGSNLTGELLDNHYCKINVPVPFDEGHVVVDFADNFPVGLQAMRPALDGTIFIGEPALGFVAINYVNANVTPGVLSNYSGAYPHRSAASCTKSANPQAGC